MSARLRRTTGPTTLLARLIDAPDLVPRVRALPPASFASLVRRVGVEDAGELVALASTSQLVAAFDEDLFSSDRPGERERFDVDRFVTWLEVLLEAGDEIAAARFAELSEDFVVHAISSVVLVLDEDALRARIEEDDRDARLADKALESALTEEIDGYLLVAKRHDGWDAALALVVALDRDHRALLVRLLDRCAAIASAYVDDIEALTELLSAEETLAEDIEAEREDRRSKAGFVEPRAAKSFLALARTPIAGEPADAARDPVTRAYFRALEPRAAAAPVHPEEGAASALALLEGPSSDSGRTSPRLPKELARREAEGARLLEAMRALRDADEAAFSARVEELAYLANVAFAGGVADDGGRLDAASAATRALVTVERGAELWARGGSRARSLLDALRACHADVLFRLAESSPAPPPKKEARGATAAKAQRSVLVRERRRQPP